MQTKYKPSDIVYVVSEFRVIKSVITDVVITRNTKGETVEYVLYSYNDLKKKQRKFIEAMLVDNLEDAKKSALTNWERIKKQVEEGIKGLTNESFEPIKDDSK